MFAYRFSESFAMTDEADAVDLANLAKHVLARRTELDMTQLDVWNAGGPSNSTLTAIEAGRPPAPSRSTLRKLDQALAWTEGSAKSALAGRAPTPLIDERTEATQRVRQLTAELDDVRAHLASARYDGTNDEHLVDLLERKSMEIAARLADAHEQAALRRDYRPTVGAQGKDADSLLYRRPDGVSDAEWERIRDQSRDYIEWLIEKAARER